jgi:hypothetical protein
MDFIKTTILGLAFHFKPKNNFQKNLKQTVKHNKKDKIDYFKNFILFFKKNCNKHTQS